MAQREWVEKDFYKELGVSSDASADEIKRAYRKLARDLHPDTQPETSEAEERFKAVSRGARRAVGSGQAQGVRRDRRLFAGGGFGRGRFNGRQLRRIRHRDGAEFNLNDLFDARRARPVAANIGDLFGGLFGSGAAAAPEPAAPRQRPGDRNRARLHARPPRAWRCRCG